MKGTITYDLEQDFDMQQLAQWLNDNQERFEYTMSYTGRYLVLEFKAKELIIGYGKKDD